MSTPTALTYYGVQQMKLWILAACLALVVGVPSIAGAEFTKDGPPPFDPLTVFHGGGGGGP